MYGGEKRCGVRYSEVPQHFFPHLSINQVHLKTFFYLLRPPLRGADVTYRVGTGTVTWSRLWWFIWGWAFCQ